MISVLLQDFRFALRSLRKAHLFSAIAVLSLAFGIGANTAVFSLTDQILVRSLAVDRPDQLVLFSSKGQHYGGNSGSNRLSYPMYQDFRDKAGSMFQGMFCFRELDLSANYHGRTERVSGELVSGNYFPVLGVKPVLGRLFTASDDLQQGGHPVAVLSYGFWRSRFAGDPQVVGRKLVLNGYPFTIVGVSQAGFHGTDPGYAPEIRIPVTMAMKIDRLDLNERRFRWVTVFARLKPDVTAAQAQARLQVLFHQILSDEVQQKAFAKASPYMKQQFLRMSIEVLPAGNGRSDLRAYLSKPLLVLTCLVGLVLVIACANVANLLIARAAGRQKEIAVRLALGSGRFRIASQLLVESFVLAFLGGILGLLLAFAIDSTLIKFLPTGSVPLVLSAAPHGRVLLFTLGISIVTAILFGLAPSLQAARPDIARTLKDQAGAVARGTSAALRKSLVIAQIALALLLLISAGLFVRSLHNLSELDPGFQTSNLLSFAVDPTMNGYDKGRSKTTYSQIVDALSQTPGVGSASLAVVAVLRRNEWDQWVTVDGYTPGAGELPDPHMNFVAPGYFDTLKIRFAAGRDFRRNDVESSEKVCIVNESFARKYFKTTNALGRHIGMGIDPGTKTDITIVGVVRDTKYESMREAIPEEVFRPYAQMDFATGMTGYVRTSQPPARMFETIRRRIRAVDANLPVFDMITLEQQKDDSLVIERLVALLSSGFAVLATLLASIGLYGVMAYMVERRTREIGVRMAIGAGREQVLWLIMREVLAMLLIGTLIALPTALLLSRLVRSQLYGLEPADPLSIVTATLLIAAVAALAGYVPALRATRVDPIRAVRYE